jgi:hypothetical protein
MLFVGLVTFSGCSRLDVIGNGSVKAFDEVLSAMGSGAGQNGISQIDLAAEFQEATSVAGQIDAITSASETVDSADAAGVGANASVGWALFAPDGDARFVWSEDYSGSARYDAAVEFTAPPFIKAGLDPDKLPYNFAFKGGKLVVGTKFGDDSLEYDGDATAIKSYEQIVSHYREAVGYHAALDHYGVSLGDGNMFEWAKDMKTNDKDIVFVLNPEPLIAAGVDPEKVDGWVYAKVPVMAEGKTTEVYKLLKPFDLQ